MRKNRSADISETGRRPNEAGLVGVRPGPSTGRHRSPLRDLARGLLGLAMVVGCGGLATGCEEDSSVDPDAGACPQVTSPAPGFCLEGRIETIEDDNACPTITCVPEECPVYQRPECAEGEQVEVTTSEAGCNVPRCVPDLCPQVAAPPADFCPEGERIDQYVNDAGCTDFRCVPAECPVYQIPQCPPGEHVETVLNEQACYEPVCVADLDPCSTIAAPDATFCPGGQVLLDEIACQWVCHGGDRCPFIGDFAACQGTTVILSDPETHCLTGIDCQP